MISSEQNGRHSSRRVRSCFRSRSELSFARAPTHHSRASTGALRRAALLTALLTAAGCEETVLLGNECSNLIELPCALDSGASRPSERPPPGPPEMPDAEVEEDAEIPPDTEVSPTSDLEIQNPDFERPGGIDGDLVVTQVAMDFLDQLRFLNFVDSELPYWYACWPLSVTSNSQLIPGARDTDDYLSFVPSTFNLFGDFVPVRQDLERPLKAGETVHLQVEVIADRQSTDGLYLAILGDNGQCAGPGNQLSRSEVIPDTTDWQPVCVTFHADQDYSVLVIKPTVQGSLPPATSPQPTLQLDSLKLVPACP
jgi:hypothetical protein